jgi:hypothetical protein
MSGCVDLAEFVSEGLSAGRPTGSIAAACITSCT